jgi:hypothetical protein
MKTLGLILSYGVLVVLSALGLLFLFPLMKEGASLGELPMLLGGLGLFVLTGALWWLARGRSVAKAAAAWVILAVPSIAYIGQAGALVTAYFGGLRLAQDVAIENFSEVPIHWPGFDGPVGVTISFDAVHPDRASALILPPEIRMGPALDIPRSVLSASRTSGSGYFKDYYLDQPVSPLTLLKTVLFQRLYVNRQAEQEYQNWTSAYDFEAGGRTRLVYNLHPGTIDYLEGPSRLCLASDSFGHRPCAEGQDPKEGCTNPNRRIETDPLYGDGADLSALWMAAGGSDLTADLSPLLTEVLRAQSTLQGDPAAWTAMQKRLEPAGLSDAGYSLCPPGETSHTAFRTCYCRDAAD